MTSIPHRLPASKGRAAGTHGGDDLEIARPLAPTGSSPREQRSGDWDPCGERFRAAPLPKPSHLGIGHRLGTQEPGRTPAVKGTGTVCSSSTAPHMCTSAIRGELSGSSDREPSSVAPSRRLDCAGDRLIESGYERSPSTHANAQSVGLLCPLLTSTASGCILG